MKHRIEPSQLQELTPEQQERLRGQWIPETEDIVCNEHGEAFRWGDVIFVKNKKFYPLLDIAQMIELLTENKAFVHFSVWDCRLPDKGINYRKISIVDGIGLDCEMVDYEEEELADALFAAVKAVL